MNTEDRMRCVVNWDWCTYICPCGESHCTRGVPNKTTWGWLKAHQPHTNGQIHTLTSADEMRAWENQNVPDTIHDFDGNLVKGKEMGWEEFREFNLMIGTLDRVLSQMILAATNPNLDEADWQTLKHHADDMHGAADHEPVRPPQ